MDPFVTALNELMTGRGISNNELSRQIDVDPAQVGRWRKGKGRPRPENLVRAAGVFGVDHEWLWSLAYPEGIPAADGPRNPRLAAFMALIEAAFHTMTAEQWEVREPAGRALFSVASIDAKTHRGRSAKAPRGSISTHSNTDEHGSDNVVESHYPRVYRPLALSAAHS